MAKKPVLPRRGPGATQAGAPAPAKPPAARPPAPPPVRVEAAGKFDKFSTFALVLPCTLLALITLVYAIGYTADAFDVGFFGFPKKKAADWNAGSEAVQRLQGSVQITGFGQSNYIARSSDGEVDVALLNVGSVHRVNVGDVFTLTTENADVRIEFVVFDVQSESSQAYILLGQNVAEGKPRKYGLKPAQLSELCGGLTNVPVKREWQQQIVRRWAEARSTAG